MPAYTHLMTLIRSTCKLKLVASD